MTNTGDKRKGFSAIEVVIVLLTIAAVGVAGFYVYSNQMGDSESAKNNGQSFSKSEVPTAPAINNTSDLSTAQQTLDQTNLDASNTDVADLNQALSSLQ